MDSKELRERALHLIFSYHHDGPPKNIGNMTAGEKGILGFLHRSYPQPQYSGDLAVHLHVGTGRIGNALKSLEAKQLIKREVDETDKRKVLVSLTPKGYQMIEEQLQNMNLFLDEVIQGFGQDRFNAFLSECEQFMKVIETTARKEAFKNHV